MSLVKRLKGRRLVEEARDALAADAARTREENPVWQRWEGEKDEDMILMTDRRPGRDEIIVRERQSMFATQQAVLGARLAPVYFQRSVLEEMAKAGVERAMHALEEDRRMRTHAPKALPPKEASTLKRYRFAVGIAGSRRVTVRAANESDARLKARSVLDRRAEKAGREPPVGWDLRLVEVT